MKQMPIKIKNKLRQMGLAAGKVKTYECEVVDIFEEYGIDISKLDATRSDIYSNEPSTEAFAFISNAEGNIEEDIKEIEEVFLYYVNKLEGY